MYEGIFDDFNIIKKHCKRNGDLSFEESAVFELLENLFPQYGSVVSVQVVIEMLDAQRIRDCKIDIDYSKCQLGISDKSNDNDSITEIEVLPKIYPYIDLTDNSPEAVHNHAFEKFKNQNSNNRTLENDSGIHEGSYDKSNSVYNELKDIDLLKNLEDDSTQIVGDIIYEVPPLVSCLFREPNKLISNSLEINSSLIEEREVIEMLEENNNDPNNNLSNIILDNEPLNTNYKISDNNERIDSIHSSKNLSLKNVFKNEIFDTTPGCSKDYGCQSSNSIPGCSKDFDFSVNRTSCINLNESIQNDAICIREIVPWANNETVYCILRKHKDSPNRKQLALWDLMSDESNSKDTSVLKRKQEKDICAISKKCFKINANDIDRSAFDLKSNIELNYDGCSESSNNLKYSRIPEYIEHNSNHLLKSQTSKISTDTENCNSNSIDLLNATPKISNNVNLYIVNDKIVNDYQKFIKPVFANIISTDYYKKKHKNETIVSGSLKIASDPLTEIVSTTNFYPSLTNNFQEQSVNINNLSNSNTEMNIDNGVVNRQFGQKEIEEAANAFLNVNGASVKSEEKNLANVIQITNSENNEQKKFNLELGKANVIQPARLLLLNHSKPSQVFVRHSRDCYIRPAKFNSNINNNKNQETCKTIQSKSENILNKNISTTSQSFLINKNNALTVGHLVNNNISNSLVSSNVMNSCDKKIISNTNITISQSVKNLHPNFLIKRSKILFPVKATSAPTIIPVTTSSITKSVMQKSTVISEPTVTITSTSKPIEIITPGLQTSTSNSKVKVTPSTEVPHPTIYSKLRSIFPDIKESYVQKICISPPNGLNYNDKQYILNALIDHLLNEGHNHTRSVEDSFKQSSKVTVLSIDEQYEYLLGIFPDADPTYLRQVVEKNNSEDILDQFIQQKLETREYPTKEQYLAKIKITEQQKQYTTDFKVENFLELFPKPFQYFENSSRKCIYQPIAFEFLKSFFNKNKINTVSRQYKFFNYNLSLTAKNLQLLGPDKKSRRTNSEMPTENIPLLQELAFIKNKKNIQNYIDTLKTKEEQLFKDLQEKNLLLTCQCCFNDECMPTKSSQCNDGHIFCYECIIRGTESTLADGESHVRCFMECSSEFSLATLQKVLPPTKFSTFLKKKQAAEVIAASVDGLVSCPFCHFASIPPPEDRVFNCLNPECMKQTCRQCKELNHVPLRCDEVIKADKARRLLEEKMTEALLRTCYKCKRQFYKEDGCNRMTCPCGASMCYLCDKPISGYTHFNAQGGEKANLCPLWSDDRRMNAEAVIKVAEVVKESILKTNPSLQIDTESLLPKLPRKTKGPHDDIPNANQLPDHIKRVAGTAP